jgi:hypothetical protein
MSYGWLATSTGRPRTEATTRCGPIIQLPRTRGTRSHESHAHPQQATTHSNHSLPRAPPEVVQRQLSPASRPESGPQTRPDIHSAVPTTDCSSEGAELGASAPVSTSDSSMAATPRLKASLPGSRRRRCCQAQSVMMPWQMHMSFHRHHVQALDFELCGHQQQCLKARLILTW